MYDDPREDSWAAQAQWRRAVFGLTAVLLLGGSALAASPLARSSSKLVAPRAELRRQFAATSAVETPVALRSSGTIGPHPAEAIPTTSPAPHLIDAAVHDVAEASLVGVAEVPVLAVDVDPSAAGAADGGVDAPAPPPPGTEPAGTVAAPPATVAAAPPAVAATPTTPPPTTTPPTPPTTPPHPPPPPPPPPPLPAAAPVPADTSTTVPDDGDGRGAGTQRGGKAEEAEETDEAEADGDAKEHGNKHQRGDGGDDVTDAETADTTDG
jgi:hypothetical protein